MRRGWFLAVFLLLWNCGGKNVEMQVGRVSGSEPDRVLYDQAIKDLSKNRFAVARLTLQTLINTYPDSEFLPEAKYALAESFYREGTSSNLNQAEIEFKDYITFFPTSERADDAQLMIAMSHVRQIEKPDRDPTQALLAESELNRMIESYPDSPLLDEAKQKLRSVQDILAEGVFKVGNQYLLRRSFAAATSRYQEVLDKYPDFAKTPEVLFSLAQSYRFRNDIPQSATYYARVISDYPYSEVSAEAKQQLSALKLPIPEPNPAALARGQVARNERGLFGKFFATLSRRPALSSDTGASSVRIKEAQDGENKEKTDAPPDKQAEPVRGGTGGASLSIEQKSPDKPVKKP